MIEQGEKKSYKSWEMSDEFWEVVKDQIPLYARETGKEYKRKPGAGRPAPDYRPILGKILYVLRTGCQWKSIPQGSNVHRYFQLWQEAGFFEWIWAKGLKAYDEVEGLEWDWLALDGCMTKAPLATESVGSNPTDRGKKGDKTQRFNGGTRSADRDCDSRGKRPRYNPAGENP